MTEQETKELQNFKTQVQELLGQRDQLNRKVAILTQERDRALKDAVYFRDRFGHFHHNDCLGERACFQISTQYFYSLPQNVRTEFAIYLCRDAVVRLLHALTPEEALLEYFKSKKELT